MVKKPTIENPGNTKAERDGSDISTTGFEMGDIGTSHVLVANKFALARPHIMVLTTDGHRRQYEPLDGNDLTAAWNLLNALNTRNGLEEGKAAKATARDSDYVVFFNCGRDGGCSRLHKHMQLMPTPAETFASFLDDTQSESEKDPDVPFYWFYHRFAANENNITPIELAKIYADLLQQAAAVGKGTYEHNEDLSLPGAAVCPHNLVFTRRWMLVIPRRRGAVKKGIASNAIGMLGVIPVASRDEMQDWIQYGVANGLRELGVPKNI